MPNKRKPWVCEGVKIREIEISEDAFAEKLAKIWQLLLQHNSQLEVLSSTKDRVTIEMSNSETKRSAS